MEAKEKTDLVVLGIVNFLPLHGYLIEIMFKDYYPFKYISISKASIYNSLKRLTNKEFVKSKFIVEYSKPNRTIYYITDKGKEYLKYLVKRAIVDFKMDSQFEFIWALNYLFMFEYDECLTILKERRNKIESIIQKIEKEKEVDNPFRSLKHIELNYKYNYEQVKIEKQRVDEIIHMIEIDNSYFKDFKEKLLKIIKNKIMERTKNEN